MTFYYIGVDAVRRRLRRKQLDALITPFAAVKTSALPYGWWIRAIRQALGMSLEQFARRLGLASSSTAYQLEHAETQETLTLKRMRAAADVLGCDLVVALVPREPLEEKVKRQARHKAEERLSRVGHSMALEAQGGDDSAMEFLLDESARQILEKGGSDFWE